MPQSSTWILRDLNTHGTIFKVNMSVSDSLALQNPDASTIEIIAVASVTRNYTMKAGWNMISLPVAVSDTRRSVLFPSSASEAFGFDQFYVPVESLRGGAGYWLKFNNQQHVTLSGQARTEDTLIVQEGWNMVGAATIPIPTLSIQTEPSGILQGHFFVFNAN